MPIYAYRCADCGFAKDVLQKISDPLLTVCLSCGNPSFKKQLTAAGFQLKGTGWYATDFRGGAAPAAAASSGPAEGAAPSASAAPAPASDSAPVSAKPASPASSAKPASAAGGSVT